MKDEQHHPFYERTRLSITKLFTHHTATFVILVSLSYAMGYLSCSFPTQQQRQQLLPQLTPPPSVYQLDSFRVTALLQLTLSPTSSFDRLFNNTSLYTNFPPPYHGAFLGGKRMKGWGS
ncbi:hypothetical protein V6N13_016857 [Hibiscus sabdariffa]|uniref:Uncharacterized protein n=1 Tax=Hibiscus sabdariffa TaxID=183260 RepID=A0ABR2PUX8_9ROSI